MNERMGGSQNMSRRFGRNRSYMPLLGTDSRMQSLVYIRWYILGRITDCSEDFCSFHHLIEAVVCAGSLETQTRYLRNTHSHLYIIRYFRISAI